MMYVSTSQSTVSGTPSAIAEAWPQEEVESHPPPWRPTVLCGTSASEKSQN